MLLATIPATTYGLADIVALFVMTSCADTVDPILAGTADHTIALMLDVPEIVSLFETVSDDKVLAPVTDNVVPTVAAPVVESELSVNAFVTDNVAMVAVPVTDNVPMVAVPATDIDEGVNAPVTDNEETVVAPALSPASDVNPPATVNNVVVPLLVVM